MAARKSIGGPKRLKLMPSNRLLLVANRELTSTSFRPLLIAIVIEIIIIASTFGNIQGVLANSTNQNNAVCIFDRYTKLAKPISFAECPKIETHSLKKSGFNIDEQKDGDLKYQWMFRYLDELKYGFELMVRETSFDEKVSNLNYIKALIVMFDTDWYKTNLGNPESDRLFELNSAGKKVDDGLCGRQLASMLSQLKELSMIIDNKRRNNQMAHSTALEERHIRLARVLESYGRYDSGAFIGRSYFFGSYFQCSGSEMILDNDNVDAKTNSRYCVARLKVNKYLSPQIKSRQKHYLEPEMNFVTGICLPESCHTKSFDQNKKLLQELIDSQFKLPTWLYLEESLQVEAIHCGLDRDSYLAKIPFSGWLFTLFIISWTCFVLFATIYKYKYGNCLSVVTFRETWFTQLIDSLDLSRSWENFKKKKAKDRNDRVQLNVLNPIKVVGCIFVVGIHSALGVVFTAMNMPQVINTYETTSWYYLTLTAMNIVDTFFLTSGLMVTYFVVKKYSKKEEETKFKVENRIQTARLFFQQWSSLIFARFLRLLPAYYLVFWFTKSLFYLIGSGPLWDYGSNRLTMVGGCRHETWFSPIILAAAYTQPQRQCMPQAWTVANDLFLVTLLAPLMLLLPRKPNIAMIAITILSLSSVIALAIRLQQLPESLANDLKEIKADAMARAYVNFADLYTAPYFRFASFLIGSVSGYLLFNYNESSSEKHWPKWFKGMATKFSLFIICYMIMSSALFPLLLETPLVTRFKIHHLLFLLYLTFCRLLWCISNAILFMRMTTDWRYNRLMRAFSGRFWRAMSKLNYGLLLIHLNVIIFFSATGSTTLDYFTFNRSILYLSANYFITALVALVLHVGFESPIDHFSKLILYPKRRKIDANELNSLNNPKEGEKVERITINSGSPANAI